MYRLIAVIASLLTVLVLGGWLVLRQSLALLDGDVAVTGLGGDVSVTRDGYGVVTITARSRLDAATATGFVHAQDRFFQMDLLRRTAAGELSALVGPAAIDVDRAHRLHRLRQVAERVMADMSANDTALLEAYAHGVNAGLGALRARPFEYWILRAAPLPWQPIDVLLVNYAMYFELSDADASRDAGFGALYAALPEDLREFLLNEGTPWDAPLIGAAFDVPPPPSAAVCDLRSSAAPRPPRRGAAVFAGEPVAGSNGWAVAAQRSRSGRAIVANDMHLDLRVPNIWYRLRLIVDVPESAGGGLDVTGITLPGAPVIVAGSNGAVAWGFTSSRGDWSDLVIVERDPRHPNEYWTHEGWREFEIHTETIDVRGADPVELRVRSTQWGPIIDDNGSVSHAVHWLAHEPEAANLRLWDLERAADVHEAVGIAHRVGAPPQNIMLADRNGDIAWTILGRIPIRTGYDSRRPASWLNPGTGWLGWLPSVAYPAVINPPAGFVWTANARVVDGDALLRIGEGGHALGARAGQIRDRLAPLVAATEGDMLAIQLDDRALLYDRWRDLMIAVLSRRAEDGPPRLSALESALRDWDGRAASGAVGYRLAREFRRLTSDALFASLVSGCGTLDAPLTLRGVNQSEGPLWRLVTERPAHLLPAAYPSWDDFLRAMADAALASCAPAALADCTWGELNRLEIRHPFARALPMFARWLTVHSGPLPGGRHTPRVQEGNHGASERFAVSPGDEGNGYFHMPGGQSGHPLSPFFRAGHEAWARGEPLPFLPGARAHEVILRPGGAG